MPDEQDSPARKLAKGDEPEIDSRERLEAVLEQVFDYRGDVTIQTADGRSIEGYVFDRKRDAAEPYVRLIEKDSGERVKVRFADVARVQITGRDTASGKSFETWVKKYNEAKARGEEAHWPADSLED